LITLEEFTNRYHKYGKCINQMRAPKNKLNDKQIKFQYDKYVRKQSEGRVSKVDNGWTTVREEVFIRDNNFCNLYDKLSFNELTHIHESLFQETKIIDPAHVFGKGAYPHLKYDVDNIFCLMRLFHSRLDTYHDPITGISISKEEHEDWWRRIIGSDRYNKLKRKALKR